MHAMLENEDLDIDQGEWKKLGKSGEETAATGSNAGPGSSTADYASRILSEEAHRRSTSTRSLPCQLFP
jgi:hypothetical protein